MKGITEEWFQPKGNMSQPDYRLSYFVGFFADRGCRVDCMFADMFLRQLVVLVASFFQPPFSC